MKHTLLVLALLATLVAGGLVPSLAERATAAAPTAPVASGPATHLTFLDKTRFLLHVGAAYYAFHHWVYTPFTKSAFKSGTSGRLKAIAKAAIALVFTYHELKVAYGIATKSKSKTLRALVAPLNALMGKAAAEASTLKAGRYSNTDITNLARATTSFAAQAHKNGFSIADVTVPIPGLS